MSRTVRTIEEIQSTEEAQLAFLDWLFDFEAIDDAVALIQMVSDCHDPLPFEYCDNLGLPSGSSFGDAARVVGEPWGIG